MANAKQELQAILAGIHKDLAKYMAEQVKGKDPEVLTPAFLNTVRQFLRDNNIDANPKAEPNLLDLKENLPEFQPEDLPDSIEIG